VHSLISGALQQQLHRHANIPADRRKNEYARWTTGGSGAQPRASRQYVDCHTVYTREVQVLCRKKNHFFSTNGFPSGVRSWGRCARGWNFRYFFRAFGCDLSYTAIKIDQRHLRIFLCGNQSRVVPVIPEWPADPRRPPANAWRRRGASCADAVRSLRKYLCILLHNPERAPR